jgi:dipeptidyl aminopeptidase/acylaminoacyl peptidase
VAVSSPHPRVAHLETALRLIILMIAMLGAPLAAQGAPQLARRPLAADDGLRALAELSTPTSTRISPDGRTLLYTLVVRDSAGGEHVEGIWRVSTAGGAARNVAARGRTPRWSPDGKSIAYLARGADAASGVQLWLIEGEGGTPRQLTRLAGSGVSDFEWSPDGRTIAIAAATRGRDADTTVRTQIHLLSPRDGALRQLTRSSGTIIVHLWDPDANLAWSPDGRVIAFAEKPSPRFDDDYESDLYVVSVDGGETRPLVVRPGMDMRPVWSPDGERIAFRSSFGSLDRFGDHGLSLVGARGGAPRDVGRHFEGGFLDGPYTYAWTFDGRAVLFLGADSLGTTLFALDAARGTTRRVSRGQAKRSQLSVARSADAMAFVMADSVRGWELVVSPATTHAPRPVSSYGDGVARTLETRVSRVRWRSGEWSLDGVLLRPDGADSTRALPLITVLHGGPEGHAALSVFPELPSPIFEAVPRAAAAQSLVAQGFAVFLPNFRGSGGRGRALRRAGLVNWTATFVADVMSGIDTLVARGVADSSRLALFGERSGASKVLNVLASTGRFRAAAVSDPHVDFVLEYQRLGDFRRQWESLFGGSPATAPEAYRAHSPINNADRIATPLQIVVDELAFAAPSEQALALHERLLARGIPGELIISRGRGIEEELEMARRIGRWFERWLGGD